MVSHVGFEAFVRVVLLVALSNLAIPLYPAHAEIANGTIRIGVLNDQSGIYSDSGGPGSVVAARMAVEDSGGSINGAKIEILAADHQNKADIGAAIARRWYDAEGVDAIADVPVSSVALAVQEVTKQYRRVVLNEAASSDLSGKACSPYGTQWGIDSYTMSVAPIKTIVAGGGKKWFFLAADYALGKALERDASSWVQKEGGKVVGRVAAPLGSSDFSSFLLQAQASGAEVLGLANAGGDMINTIKQANEFGLTSSGMKIVSFLLFITDVHAIGLGTSQGLLVTDSFYWDQNDEARAFARRFEKLTGKMPSTEQANVYASVTHYLKAIRENNSKDSDLVMEAMRKMPVDYFGRRAQVRADGRVTFDMTLYRVKAPPQSKGPWDYYERVAGITGREAFRLPEEGDCPLIKK